MTMEQVQGAISALLTENRRYEPDQAFTAQANVSDTAIYDRARNDPEGFWAERATEIEWIKPYDKVLEWEVPTAEKDPPWARWFVGGQLNVSYNCVDRHLKTWRRNKAAIVWEGEPGDERVLTYRDLYREVNRCAAALKKLGVKKGDRVAIYMGMIPELPIAMLACARIGAPHNVIFGGFSPESLRDRIIDSGARVVITADGGHRRGGVVNLKEAVDKAAEECDIDRILVVNRAMDATRVPMKAGRDVWWHRALDEVGSAVVEPEPLDRQAQGPAPHQRRLPGRHDDHHQVRLRPERRRRLLVHRRYRLGDRTQLHRLRPAGQRGDLRDVRGHPGLP
jgi:acetyl-CoA synthetase